MHITLQALSETLKLPRPNCLGCIDCEGICRHIRDLVMVPDCVLRKPAKTP